MKKFTRKQFESHLFQLNDKRPMIYRKHNDFNYETNSNTILHLYYNDEGHIGTWQRGGNYYIFDERLPLTSYRQENPIIKEKV